jgi:hypothetical protein
MPKTQLIPVMWEAVKDLKPESFKKFQKLSRICKILSSTRTTLRVQTPREARKKASPKRSAPRKTRKKASWKRSILEPPRHERRLRSSTTSRTVKPSTKKVNALFHSQCVTCAD